MPKIKSILVFVFFLLLFSWSASSARWDKFKSNNLSVLEKNYTLEDATLKKLKLKSDDAISFTKKNGYNESICFFVDMSLPSGQNRFFIYDMLKDSVLNSGLVTHGRCNQLWLDGRKYSNEAGCGCSSLGKYKIGHSYNGRFGLAYKLYGLDKTNSNAFKRFVVLHAHQCVPGNEVMNEICQSDGCPTVSPQFLQQLKPMINKSQKPILLWIYE